MYERIKAADTAFGDLWKFENFLNEISDVEEFIDKLQISKDLEGVEDVMEELASLVEKFDPKDIDTLGDQAGDNLSKSISDMNFGFFSVAFSYMSIFLICGCCMGCFVIFKLNKAEKEHAL